MKIRILIASDDDVARSVYSRVLSDGRYCLTFAESIREASSLLNSGSYDLLITDPVFPDGLGIELVALFIKDSSWDKRVLVSGTPARESPAGKAHELAALRHLQKPFNAEELLGFAGSALPPLAGNSACAR